MKVNRSQYLSFHRCYKAYLQKVQTQKPLPLEERFHSSESRAFQTIAKLWITEYYKDSPVQFLWNETKETDSHSCRYEALVFSDKNIVDLWDYRPVVHLKKEWLQSLYFQRQVLTLAGYEVRNCFLLTIQKDFSLPDSVPDVFLETHLYLNLLAKKEGMSKLQKIEKSLDEDWNLFHSFLQDPKFVSHSEKKLPLCNTAKSCYHKKECFGEEELAPVYFLRQANDILPSLLEKGIKDWGDLPEELLKPIQKIQKKAHVSNSAYYDLEQLKKFFSPEEEILCFLDFETTNPVIPLYPKTNPFQHIPFLFSLHIYYPNNQELQHKTSLVPPSALDPRPKILQDLVNWIPNSARILSFNDFFEKKVIQESVSVYPQFQDFWKQIESRFMDMAVPFRLFWAYDPRQNGSCSLKDILPAHTNYSYKELEIKDGAEANHLFLKALKKEYEPEEEERILKSLVEYCSMDSYALYLLYQKLREKIKSFL